MLGGGGVLGASEVGMVGALLERRIVPDLIVGSSIGALNGVVVAANPTLASVQELTRVWNGIQIRDVFATSMVGQIANVVRHGTYLHSNEGLRKVIDGFLGGGQIEDLPVTFQCVAASIERASAHWFSAGPAVDAVLASCAVPGLLPPVRIGDEHFVDGGLVRSVPVGRAVDLGAERIFVLHVGRIEQPLRAPQRPWDVALVAFEIARRHQLADDLARVPPGVEVHILPTGSRAAPTLSAPYRKTGSVALRIQAARQATAAYLDRVTA